MNRTHLTPLGKLVALIVLLFAGAVAGAAGASAIRPHAQAWRCVEVGPGDTLWGMAGAADGDVRATVHEIVEHNGLHGTMLEPGMGIWVPRPSGERIAPDEPTTCVRPR